MNIEWTRWAINEWIESLDYLEHESPSAAARISVAVVDTLIMLADHPYGGPCGEDYRNEGVCSSAITIHHRL